MSATTISQLLGKEDIIEDCRQKVRVLSNDGQFRISAEILMKNGSRRFYCAKAIDRKSAIREILTFVAAVEDATNEKVFWRLKGDKTYHMSTSYEDKPSFFQKAKNNFLKYFFELEE